MFREIAGIPAHALLVHAAVVFVPSLIAIAVGYAILPRWRTRLGWAAALLAVTAPASALLARLSGEELQRVLIEKGYAPEILRQVAEHRWYGERVLWFSAGLGAATLLMLLLGGERMAGRSPRWVNLTLVGVIVALAVVTGFYVYMTGDTGAKAVWRGVL